MRFVSIYLENWRNFTRVDVPLQQRMFLVGPNASGKSNFLDAFRFLRDLVIQNALRVAVPQLQELTEYKDNRGVPHLRAKYDHWRSKGAWQTEADFSDGTLRLMGLLWALLDGNGPLILEEPELSLHAEVASQIPQMMASIQKSQRKQARQIFVSTHSSDLLRDPGIAADEVLILRPTSEGTKIEVSIDNAEIKQLLESGLPISEAVLPQTRPPRAEQLSHFGNE